MILYIGRIQAKNVYTPASIFLHNTAAIYKCPQKA